MAFNLFRHHFIFLFLLASSVVFAQKTNFGFYAGPSVSTLRMEQVAASDFIIDPYDYKLGFTFGAFGALNVADNVAIRGEVNFERKGGKSGIGFSNGQGNPLPKGFIKEQFDYLQVPLLFQLSAGKDFKMFIHIGYGFGYLLHRTEEFPGSITVRIDREPDPPKFYALLMPEDYKKIDHSLVAGIGASPVLANGLRLQFSLRAYNGKVNLAQGESAFDAKNLSVVLLAGVEF